MPKVTRKEAEGPLREVPQAMDVDDGGQLPEKPTFAALSAQEQQGSKVEFRRVSGSWAFMTVGDYAMACACCRPAAVMCGHICTLYIGTCAQAAKSWGVVRA